MALGLFIVTIGAVELRLMQLILFRHHLAHDLESFCHLSLCFGCLEHAHGVGTFAFLRLGRSGTLERLCQECCGERFPCAGFCACSQIAPNNSDY